jgi:CRP-like cAMP-binding protein
MSGPQLTLVNFRKGAYVIVEGKQRAEQFYIIRSGKVQIRKQVEIAEEQEESVLVPGDFFGVVSTMSAHSHIESAIALTDVSLIAVGRDQFGLLIERNAPVAMKIILQFSKRMRNLDGALTRLNFKNTAGENPSHLFKVAEYYLKQSQYNQAYYAYFRYLQHCAGDEHVKVAKERMAKIQPYSKAVYLDGGGADFTRVYPKSTMIFSENEPGKELYIIQKGVVKISKIVDDKEVLIALLPQGDIFGEMALLENRPRSASAIAHEDVTLLAVNQSNFERMVQTQPQIITRLTTLLAERIWFVYKQLANAMIKNPLGRLYDSLMLQLEKNRVNIAHGESHKFDFGPKELINMVGLSASEGADLLRKLFENRRLKVVDNKIETTDLEEIQKQADYFKKMELIDKSRREARAGAT